MNHKFEQISDNCYLLHFLPKSEGGLLTSILLIAGKEHLFVVDTAYGSNCMELVKDFKAKNFKNKFIIVFNTHSHWDHVWGNNVFRNNPRFAHYLCNKRMKIHDRQAQIDYQDFIEGGAETCLPDILFDSEICFDEEGVRFFHSPGHTPDSCSVYFEKDKLLFVADNLELPLPFIESDDFSTYINTLEKYKELKPAIIVTSHSSTVSSDLIDRTIDYLKNFNTADEWLNLNLPEWSTHLMNKKTITKVL